MPPAVEFSDDESTGGSIPYDDGDQLMSDAEAAKPLLVAAVEKKGGDVSEDEENEEEDEDLFVVERVMGHDFAKDGSLLLQVKWKGYDDPTDETMEPEENLLDGAQDILDEYFKKQGGRPVKPTKGAKKRKSLGEPKEKKEKETPAKKRNKVALGSGNDSEALSTDWVPKSKSWESEVNSVDTIQRDKDGKLFAYLVFNNGKKSKVSIHMCYEKCPLKMLGFYEQHLVFKDETAP